MKEKILQYAEAYRHSKVYVPEDDNYQAGFASKPEGVSRYDGGVEPVVAVPDVLTGSGSNAWLTVNRYNAVVLNTRNMLMADIDFGDEQLSSYAGAKDAEELIDRFKELDALDESLCHDFVPDDGFAKQSYRVYRTCNGCRVICTSRPFDWRQEWCLARRLMRFFKTDQQYMTLCGVQECYRARLTPKPWRVTDANHVCSLVHSHGSEVHPHLAEQLSLHDAMTLPDGKWESTLA